MYTIYKQTLVITERQVISVPAGAEFLSVADQRGELCVWFKCNPANPGRDRAIRITGTGHEMPNELRTSYIGSVVMNPFVWHVFEET